MPPVKRSLQADRLPAIVMSDRPSKLSTVPEGITEVSQRPPGWLRGQHRRGGSGGSRGGQARSTLMAEPMGFPLPTLVLVPFSQSL